MLMLCVPTLHAQWERAALPFDATAISSNGAILWICGAESGIASSSDGGTHWDIRNRESENVEAPVHWFC